MEVQLIMAGGKNSGQEVPVTGPRFFIGRAEDCQLRPRSDLISRHHCVILVEEGFVAVRDFGSKNGTYVNGQRITSEAELKSGDILKIGPIEFQVRVGGETSPRREETVAKPAEAATKPVEAPAAEAPAKGAELGGKKKPKVRSVQEAAARTVESAASAKDDDEDVSAWLDDDEGGATTETTALEPTRMAKSPPDTGPQEPASEPAEQESEDEDEEEKDKPKSQAFEVPGTPRGPTTATSKDAATNMLKNFFHRR